MTAETRRELHRLAAKALAIQEAHDLNLEHYGECPRCGEYGSDAIGEGCEPG